jgi:hypothetical protein
VAVNPSGAITLFGSNLRTPFEAGGTCTVPPGNTNRAVIVFQQGAGGPVLEEVIVSNAAIGATSVSGVPFTTASTAAPATLDVFIRYELGFNVGAGTIYGTCATSTSATLRVVRPVNPVELPDGFRNETYAPVTFTLVGAQGPVTWELSDGTLPNGMTFSAQGVLSGTPTESGFFYLYFTVTDSLGSQQFDRYLVINERITLNPPTLPNGVFGQVYDQVISAPNATEVWTEDALPPGLSIQTTYDQGTDTYTFRITGTPTTPGSYPFRLFAVGGDESVSYFGFRDYVIVIESGVTVVTATLPAATVGVAYSAQLQTNRNEPLEVPVWQVVSGSLPPGLTLTPSTGLISGTPTQGGTFNFSVQVTIFYVGQQPTGFPQNGLASPPRALSITVAVPVTLSILTTNLPNGVLGETYAANLQFSLTGSTQPVVWQIVSGALPGGLSLNTATGQITGIPTAAGSYGIVVVARLANGTLETPPRQLSITISERELSLFPLTLAGGQVTQPYFQELRPSGGVGNYAFAVVSGALPPGLSLQNVPLGISGVPTTAGIYAFTLRLTSGSQSLDARYTIEIRADLLRLITLSLPEGTAAAPYSHPLEAAGGTSPYTFSVRAGGNLPPGLTLSPGGLLSGTPTTAGNFTFTIQVTDTRQAQAAREYTMTILGALTLGPTPLPEATEGEAYSASLSASGGRGPYTFSQAGGSLPAGLSLAADGRITGRPTQAGRFVFTAGVVDANRTRVERAIELPVIGAIRIAPDTLPEATQLRPYSASLSVTGGVGPFSWSLTGALPAGVQFANGSFSGTPSEDGAFPVQVAATDSRGRSGNRSYTLTVAARVEITTTSLPAGTAGSAYGATLAAIGGRPPYTWSVTGALPEGISLNAAQGALSGTPLASGSFPLTFRAADADGVSATALLTLTVNMPPPPTVRIVNLPATSPPASQPSFGVTLAESFPLPLQGTVDLTFAPDRGPDDPAVQFASGGRRLTFTIGANQTTANFGSASPALQTGTVAGLITLTTRYTANGVDVTPTPPPTQTLRIPGAAPVLTRLELNRTTNGFELVVTGYSNTRDVSRANVRITPAGGASVTGTELTVDLGALFTSYYGSAASAPFGTQFRLALPFSVSGALSDIASASITLTNSAGTSNSLSVNF